MYSFGEIRRQAYLLQKKLNLLPERNKIVDVQEEDMGRVNYSSPESPHDPHMTTILYTDFPAPGPQLPAPKPKNSSIASKP